MDAQMAESDQDGSDVSQSDMLSFVDYACCRNILSDIVALDGISAVDMKQLIAHFRAEQVQQLLAFAEVLRDLCKTREGFFRNQPRPYHRTAAVQALQARNQKQHRKGLTGLKPTCPDTTSRQRRGSKRNSSRWLWHAEDRAQYD